eukprot:3262752-Ditylum_brightwellii.AAC.1
MRAAAMPSIPPSTWWHNRLSGHTVKWRQSWAPPPYHEPHPVLSHLRKNTMCSSVEPRTIPIPPTSFITAAQMKLLRQQYQAKLLASHMHNNMDTALRNQLITATIDMYLAPIKQEHIGYTNPSCGD